MKDIIFLERSRKKKKNLLKTLLFFPLYPKQITMQKTTQMSSFLKYKKSFKTNFLKRDLTIFVNFDILAGNRRYLGIH